MKLSKLIKLLAITTLIITLSGNIANAAVPKSFKLTPAFFKCFDELLVNAHDHKKRMEKAIEKDKDNNHPVTTIKININDEKYLYFNSNNNKDNNIIENFINENNSNSNNSNKYKLLSLNQLFIFFEILNSLNILKYIFSLICNFYNDIYK